MDIIKIEDNNFADNNKLSKMYVAFVRLIDELKKYEVDSEVIAFINSEIEKINSFSGKDKKFLKLFVHSQERILKLLETKLGLVTKKHYQNAWMSTGLAVGLSIGVAIGASTDNMGMMAVGLPIGIAIGMQLGKGKDKKVFEEGKQLDVEIENGVIVI